MYMVCKNNGYKQPKIGIYINVKQLEHFIHIPIEICTFVYFDFFIGYLMTEFQYIRINKYYIRFFVF